MSNVNPVAWFEIYVNDMARAVKFYETILNTTLNHMPMPEGAGSDEMYTFNWVEGAPNASGALVKDENRLPNAEGTLVYFHSEDCAIEIGRVEAAGGVIIMPKFSIGEHGFIALATDSEGNTIGFHSNS